MTAVLEIVTYAVDLWQLFYRLSHLEPICVYLDRTPGVDLWRLFCRFLHRESNCDDSMLLSIESFIQCVPKVLQILTPGIHIGRFKSSPHWLDLSVLSDSIMCFCINSQGDMNSQANIILQANSRTRLTRPCVFLSDAPLLHRLTWFHKTTWFNKLTPELG